MALEQPGFLQALSYPAEQFRNETYGFLLARGATIGSVAGGVVNLAAGDFIMSAPVSGMSVNNATGQAVVPGTSSTTQSGYPIRGTSTTNTSVSASSPSLPRIDLNCISIADAQYTGVTNAGSIQVVTGTPTSGATLSNLSGAPSLPTSSLLIGYVLVPANATNIITADLGDHRAQVALNSSMVPGSSVVATAREVELTTTGSTTIVTYTPTTSGNFVIGVYFRVVTATTAVTVTVTWTDLTGAQTLTPLSAVSEVVGSYAMVTFEIDAILSNAITVAMTAGTANQVYCSASILQG